MKALFGSPRAKKKEASGDAASPGGSPKTAPKGKPAAALPDEVLKENPYEKPAKVTGAADQLDESAYAAIQDPLKKKKAAAAAAAATEEDGTYSSIVVIKHEEALEESDYASLNFSRVQDHAAVQSKDPSNALYATMRHEEGKPRSASAALPPSQTLYSAVSGGTSKLGGVGAVDIAKVEGPARSSRTPAPAPPVESTYAAVRPARSNTSASGEAGFIPPVPKRAPPKAPGATAPDEVGTAAVVVGSRDRSSSSPVAGGHKLPSRPPPTPPAAAPAQSAGSGPAGRTSLQDIQVSENLAGSMEDIRPRTKSQPTPPRRRKMSERAGEVAKEADVSLRRSQEEVEVDEVMTTSASGRILDRKMSIISELDSPASNVTVEEADDDDDDDGGDGGGGGGGGSGGGRGNRGEVEMVPPIKEWLHGELSSSIADKLLLAEGVPSRSFLAYQPKSAGGGGKKGYVLAFRTRDPKKDEDSVLKFFIETRDERALEHDGHFMIRERQQKMWRYVGIGVANYRGDYRLSLRYAGETEYYHLKSAGQDSGTLTVLRVGLGSKPVPVAGGPELAQSYAHIHELVDAHRKNRGIMPCLLTRDCTQMFIFGNRAYYSLDDIVARYMATPLCNDQKLGTPLAPVSDGGEDAVRAKLKKEEKATLIKQASAAAAEAFAAQQLILPNYTMRISDDRSWSKKNPKHWRKITLKIDLPLCSGDPEVMESMEVRICRDGEVDYLRLWVPAKYELEVPFKPFRVDTKKIGDTHSMTQKYSKTKRQLTVVVGGLTQA